jgi:ketosteroid isomerase-like protein
VVTEALVSMLRVAFDQFERGDFEAFKALPDDFELTLAAAMPDAGTYRGEAARAWLAAWVNSFERMRSRDSLSSARPRSSAVRAPVF